MGIKTSVKGLQSEIFVPVTPQTVWAPVSKPMNEWVVGLATAAGVHLKSQERFNLAGDFTWRMIPNETPEDELMVSHGGYDNSDVNKDINCMFPIARIHELADAGVIAGAAPYHAGFMGGGGSIEKFSNETGPAIAKMFKEQGVDAVVVTAGWGTCHRSATIVQRAIEAAGIPTVIIAALPPVVRQAGTPRAVAPLVPMGANAGAPHDVVMQYNVCKDALKFIAECETPGKILPLPYEYHAVL